MANAHELAQNSANRTDPCLGGNFPGMCSATLYCTETVSIACTLTPILIWIPMATVSTFGTDIWIGVKLPIAQNFDSDRDPIP